MFILFWKRTEDNLQLLPRALHIDITSDCLRPPF